MSPLYIEIMKEYEKFKNSPFDESKIVQANRTEDDATATFYYQGFLAGINYMEKVLENRKV